MSKVLARCVPKFYYWLIGVFVYPMAAFVFTAVLIRPIFLLFGSDLGGHSLIFAWLLVTVIVAAWACLRDYRRLFYTLSSDSLALGRGAETTTVAFSEIESIVLALPNRLPWWLRIQRFNPKGRGVYRNLVRARELTMLLRLTEDRYLSLNLAYSFLANGQIFTTEFLRRNHSKIVGHQTYTEREIQGLRSAQSNTIKTIRRDG